MVIIFTMVIIYILVSSLSIPNEILKFIDIC